MDEVLHREKIVGNDYVSFYYLECENDDYNIVFHTPSFSLAKVQNTFHMHDYTQAQLREQFKNLPDNVQNDEVLRKGEGRIGLTFMSARTCNLRCKYCFAGEGEYGDVEKKTKLFSSKSYIAAVNQSLKMYPQGVKSISFFGGEPLLDFSAIKEFVPECIKIFELKNLSIPQISISTNLVAMNEEIAKFLSEYKIHCVISLDGPKSINDIARISYDPNYSVYDHVIEACGLLDKYNISYAVQATINRNHLTNFKKGNAIEWIKELEKINWTNLAVVPVETDVHELCIDEDNMCNLIEFTRELTNYYIDKLYLKEPGKIASGIIAPIAQIIKHKHVRSCSAGHSVFVDTDENVYPCQMFCNYDEYKIGDLEHDWDKDMIYKMANCNRFTSKECRNCISREICTVWCKGIQLNSHGNMYSVCKPRCVFQNTITEECIKAVARLKKGTDEYKTFLMNYKKVGEYLRRDGFITK